MLYGGHYIIDIPYTQLRITGVTQEGSMKRNRSTRRHGVLVKLNDAEQSGLELLRERESLPKAQVLRRLLVREVRALDIAKRGVQ